MLLSRHACVSLCKKKRAGNQFLVLGQARQSLFGQGGAGGQYGEVVTNIALFVTHGTQYHRIVWPDPSTSFEVYSGQFCLRAQPPHLEVKAARLAMQGARSEDFPAVFFSSHFHFSICHKTLLTNTNIMSWAINIVTTQGMCNVPFQDQ